MVRDDIWCVGVPGGQGRSSSRNQCTEKQRKGGLDSQTYLANRRVDLGRGSDFILAVKLSNTLVVSSCLSNAAKREVVQSQSHTTRAISAETGDSYAP